MVEAEVYCDRKSFEEYTGKFKKKYKVLGKKAYDYFVFFIFTSRADTCVDKFRIIVHKADLINRKPRHLKLEESYIDASKPESLEAKSVHEKIMDPANRFESVAGMKREILELILRKLNEAWECGTRFAPRRIREIELAYRAAAGATVKALGID